MTKARWYEGIPPAEAVAEHETEHPRPDGIRLGRITVSRTEGAGDYVKSNDWAYGDWICDHYQSRLQPYVGYQRLKVLDGEVLMAVGFTGWLPLSQCKWANECRFFPAGVNGLPLDYEVEP